MKSKREKMSVLMDYTIALLMVLILVLGTYLMPQIYSVYTDDKDLNQIHVVEREEFELKSPVDISIHDRVQQVLSTVLGKGNLKITLQLDGKGVTDTKLLEGIRESMAIAAQYKLFPDLSAYEIEKNIIYAEYYNLSTDATEGAGVGFWVIRFSDHATFDFTFCVDANHYTIYMAELYCAEVSQYLAEATADDFVVNFYNQEFMEGSASYYEAEGYDAFTDLNYQDMFFVMGFERDDYGMYHTPSKNGYLNAQGIRWGFYSIAKGLMGNAAAKEWDFKTIQGYFNDKYGEIITDQTE